MKYNSPLKCGVETAGDMKRMFRFKTTVVGRVKGYLAWTVVTLSLGNRFHLWRNEKPSPLHFHSVFPDQQEPLVLCLGSR